MFKNIGLKMRAVILVVATALLVGLCVVYRDALEEIIAVVIGYFITILIGGFLTLYHLYNEDKTKMAEKDFPYDEKTYLKEVKVGEHATHVWYKTSVSGGDIKEIVVNDSDRFTYQLDPLIAANYSSLLEAHKGSFIKNIPMVRLDDFTLDEEGKLTLEISRTMYYNDLVTNRAMDYPFAGNMTVRDVFESRPHISTYKDSKLSNHIGINALVFYNDHLVLAHRAANSTMSKNCVTSTVATGLSEASVIASHREETVGENVYLTPEDIATDIVLARLCDAFPNHTLEDFHRFAAEGYIKVYFLGFGQLLYMGGKPQFYYAVTVSPDCPLSGIQVEKKKNAIDMNLHFIHARQISLGREETDVLTIDGRVGAKSTKYRTMHIKAEKSFYVNWMHLLEYGKIPGVPDWVYAGFTTETSEERMSAGSVAEETLVNV